MYRNRHGGVRSAAVAEASIFRESKVGSNVLEWYPHPHLVSEKNGKPIKIIVRVVKAYLYLEINFADFCKVFAWTVTYCTLNMCRRLCDGTYLLMCVLCVIR